MIPGFVDSHTHLVFGGDRAEEFAARMAGRRYEAGGIRSTVAATRAATDDELRARLAGFVAELHAQGTTTFEVKSGYGLSVADEERLVRLAREVTEEVTFLGAHVVPAEYADRPDEYVDLVVGEMLAACAPHSRWVDAFCERGAFTPEQSRRVLEAGAAAGLGVRVHGNQLGEGGGVRPRGRARRGIRRPLHLPRATRMSPRSRHPTPSRPCCRASSSRPASPTPTRAASSTRA